MKIVHVITRSDTVGGASVHVRDLTKALREHGHDVLVLVGGEGPFTAQLRSEGIPYRSLRHLKKPINPLQDMAAVFELCRVLREMKPEIVATHTAKAGIVGRIACAALNIPVTFTSHGWSVTDRISSLGGHLFRNIERLGAKITDRIICVCEYEQEVATSKKIAAPDSLAVVYNGIPDIPDTLRSTELSQQPPCLTMVARMERPKDHDTLLHALVPLKFTPWTARFIGDGPLLAKVRATISQLGLGDKVALSGTCDWDVAPVLKTSQMFVLSSRSEAMPLSILEAMRAGLPIIASAVGGIPEAVAHGVNGLLVPAKNPTALTDALSRLIGDPFLRVSMGNASRQIFERKFRFEKMMDETMSIYRQAALGKRVAPVQSIGVSEGVGD